MSGDDLDQARERYDLIERLVDLTPEEREVELAAVDPTLAGDVRRMLSADEAAESELLVGGIVVQPDMTTPTQIGPYQVLELLGEGGMGRVFLAEQLEPVRRRVALKILRFAAAGRLATARFEAERHAMGRLDHPNVGKILEAGTTDEGLPYFAMELIDGSPITTFCDDRSLSLEKRLELFVQVCRGTEHAHQRLLLHRDLKPSNVLVAEVDGIPVPKIIDFGIAKGLDGSVETLTMGDSLIGTPDYMSPEALGMGGDVDTRTDVFSLGVLLYELLTGHRPWSERSQTPVELIRSRAESEMVRPSTRVGGLDPDTRDRTATTRSETTANLPKRLRGDLDWIALKALDKEPSRRYSTAAHLAADILRFLHDEPVLARAPSAGYLLRKLARRHRGRVAAAVVVLLALTVGAVGTGVGLIRAREEADRANREAESARLSRDRAVVSQHQSDQLATYLIDLFGEVDSDIVNPSTLTARDLLDRGSGALEERLEGQPVIRAVLLQTVGEIYSRWDDFSRAEELLTGSLALLEEGTGVAERELVDTLEKLADLRSRMGRFVEAVEILDRAASIQKRLVETQPSPEGAVRQVRLKAKTASAQIMLGRLQDASDHLQRGLELLEAIPEETPGRRVAVARTQLELGGLAQRRRDHAGIEHYRQALAAYEVEYGPDSRRLIDPLNSLAFWLVDMNRLEEAEPVLRRTLDLQERLLGGDTFPIARGLFLLGRLLNKQGRYPEAEQAFQRSIEIKRRLLSEPHPMTSNAVALLGYMIWLQDDGRREEAKALLAEADELTVNDPAYPVFTAVMELRARVELAEGRPRQPSTTGSVRSRSCRDSTVHLPDTWRRSLRTWPRPCFRSARRRTRTEPARRRWPSQNSPVGKSGSHGGARVSRRSDVHSRPRP